MAHILVDFDERTWVKQSLDALASGLLAFGVLLCNRRLTSGGHSLVIPGPKVCQLASGGGDIRVDANGLGVGILKGHGVSLTALQANLFEGFPLRDAIFVSELPQFAVPFVRKTVPAATTL